MPFAKGCCDTQPYNRLEKGIRPGGQFFMTQKGQFRMSLDSPTPSYPAGQHKADIG